MYLEGRKGGKELTEGATEESNGQNKDLDVLAPQNVRSPNEDSVATDILIVWSQTYEYTRRGMLSSSISAQL